MAKRTMQYTHTLLAVMLSTLIAACGQQKQDAAAGGMPALPVGVIEVQPTSVPIRAEAVAQTEGAKEVEVRPRVGGILLKKMFQEGEPIKAGQTMFLIDPVPFQIAVQQAEAQLAQQKARIVQTQREADRLKGLLDTQSISQREYDNALSDNSVASATLLQYEAMLREAKLNLSYTSVTAPTSGIAGRFEFSEGALVSANTSLLTTIVQLSPIWVRFSLSDSELASLGGQLTSRNVKNIQLVLPDGTDFPESGKLNFSASEIDPALGTQQLRAVFENANRSLLPGQFVRARVTTGTRDGVFIIPQTAVLTGDQGKFVYVAEKDASGKTIAAVRPIQEGGWEGKNWVILSGLKAGDKLLADNLIKVRPGAPVDPHPLGEPPAANPKTSAKAPAKTSA
ncbi:RND family efflux transporter, MFP subunit [Methylophilaceae bacterium 11]|jgi:membrane fusion protein (multidrug efflux system)|nr:RND family efflux transporter, MFP subunit [Methylophilaceae bacterium 11]